jgi:two-component system, NarL family, invasion response regulator UvrY
MITILLADDHALVREGLCRLLQDYPDLNVVGEASNGQETLRLARQLRPDVVLMDLSMPELDGIETTKRIVDEGLKSRVMILTMHANEEYAVRVLQAGARGFVGKGAPSQEVIAAIHKVAAGGIFLPLALAEALPKRYIRKGEETPLETLSDRELQVLKRLAEGRTGRAIAQELHLSIKTVDTYRARLLAKLELSTTADLIRFALRHGVIQDTW